MTRIAKIYPCREHVSVLTVSTDAGTAKIVRGIYAAALQIPKAHTLFMTVELPKA